MKPLLKLAMPRLILLLLALLVSACACKPNNSPPPPVLQARVPPLSKQARQPPTPSECLPSCSAGLTLERESLLKMLTPAE